MSSLEPAKFLRLLLRHHPLHAPDVNDECENVYHGLDDRGVEGSSLYVDVSCSVTFRANSHRTRLTWVVHSFPKSTKLWTSS